MVEQKHGNEKKIYVGEGNVPRENNRQYIKPVQSANVLFKFMKDIEYLKTILLHKAILPRYCEEDINYLNINGINKIAFPMSCFCDIHFNKLKFHVHKYGAYGIGLNKTWGIEQGIQPIHYINMDSRLRKDFSDAFNIALENTFENKESVKYLKNYVLHHLLYMKPIDGQMKIGKDEIEDRNFHDEKEWRFIPDFNKVETQLPQIVIPPHINYGSLNSYSEGIIKKPDLWLHYKLENIKYIIVNSEQDRTELIRFIISNKVATDEEQYILFSKILVFKELGEDI
ncbi:abortive infection system antitoxin AbiGi family protein [Ureibacillus chungkukjangi]|uniref:Abortive phage resistance protein AbiGi (Putative antitoxin) n=1 Tax=Ureibacillus chungkukjangi TaxID=1202712 RepID=A0A318TTN9_9BACL|nr:abortive infection system antitoxin AbiGi family protein [Ureibacillus chungkukjangi]PYF07220.1 abortive phage resistance protein AbiGi (putative antitoxin) [Ureibacillus chungkukjangi]